MVSRASRGDQSVTHAGSAERLGPASFDGGTLLHNGGESATFACQTQDPRPPVSFGRDPLR
jgi:hypothetical protein